MRHYPALARSALAICVSFLAACSAAAPDGLNPFPSRSSAFTVFPNFTYGGGPLLHNTQVSVVSWNPAVQFSGSLPGFYSTINSSPYVTWLNEYSAGGAGNLVAAVVDPNPPASNPVQQFQIEQELTNLVSQGALPPPGANSLYMVHFPPGVQILAGGWFSCVDASDGFCGFHSSFSSPYGTMIYGVIADVGPCGSRCGPSDAFGNTTTTAGHELLEAITDPFNNSGWTDPNNGEIADACQGLVGTVSGYTVHRGWSTAQEACVVNNPCQSCPGGYSCRCGDFVCRSSIGQCP